MVEQVKNLAFSKQVTVRITFDNWISFRDFLAVFAPCGLQGASGTQAISLFDTFSFQVRGLFSFPRIGFIFGSIIYRA